LIFGKTERLLVLSFGLEGERGVGEIIGKETEAIQKEVGGN
jgi:hypothetical protein